MATLVEACPECDTSQYYRRQSTDPPYRCENGHTFDEPAERENQRGGNREKSQTRYRCPDCDDSFFLAPENADRVTCPDCSDTTPAWIAKVCHLKTTNLSKVARGPTTDFKRTRSEEARRVVRRLQPFYGDGSKDARPRAETVYYLPGDERAAVRLFVGKNTEYVESILRDDSTALQTNWDDGLYQLLVEQYHWRE